MTSSPATGAPGFTRSYTDPVGPWWHTIVLIIVIVGFSAYQGQASVISVAVHLPSRISLYSTTMAYELLLFAYVWLLGLRPRGVSLREIIGGRWSRPQDVLIDVATAFLFWIVVVAVLAVVQFVVKYNGVKGAKPLLPQTPVEMIFFIVLAVTAGFCEEFIFRGYLQRQFLALTKTVPLAIALQALIFGAAHLYQGGRAVVAITIYGALFGILASLRKSLRPGMIQHATQDTVSGIVAGILLRHKMI